MNLNRGRLRVRRGASVIAWMGSLDVVNWQFWHKGLFIGQLSVLDFDVGRIIEDILVTVPIHVVRVTRTAFDRTGQCQLTASLDMEVTRGVQISSGIWKREQFAKYRLLGWNSSIENVPHKVRTLSFYENRTKKKKKSCNLQGLTVLDKLFFKSLYLGIQETCIFCFSY